MNSAVINVRIQPDLKAKAKRVSEELGFSLSTLIKAFLKDLVRTKAISFDIPEVPSAWMIKQLKESREDVKAGRVSPAFASVDEALKYLRGRSIINSLRQKVRKAASKSSSRSRRRFSKKIGYFSERSFQSSP